MRNLMLLSIFVASNASAADLSVGLDCWTWRDNLRIEKIDLTEKSAQVSIAIQSAPPQMQTFEATVIDGGRFVKFNLAGTNGFVLLDTEGLSDALDLRHQNAQLVWEGLQAPKKGSWPFACKLNSSLPSPLAGQNSVFRGVMP